MEQTRILIGNPQISLSVLHDRARDPAGNAACGNKPVILQVTEVARRDDPYSPAAILKQRKKTAGVPMGIRAAFAVNRNLPIIPPVQAANNAEPNASIVVRQRAIDGST